MRRVMFGPQSLASRGGQTTTITTITYLTYVRRSVVSVFYSVFMQILQYCPLKQWSFNGAGGTICVTFVTHFHLSAMSE